MSVISDLSGRTALVTGGTSGIGLATARAFLDAGAGVVVCGRSPERGATAVADLSRHGDVRFVPADVSDEQQVSDLLADATSVSGRLDFAVNCASNAEALGPRAGFTQTPLSEFEGILRTMLTSVWLCMRAEIAAMSQGGAIVNVSSADAGLLSAGTSSYAVSKLGVEALTITVAKEYAAQGVRVNAVRPGAILTPMLERHLAGDSDEARQRNVERYEQVIAMRRIGDPAEVAAAALWLCSDASSYVTGQVLSVDGALGL